MVEMLASLPEVAPEGITIGLEYARLIREFMPEELDIYEELEYYSNNLRAQLMKK